MHSHLLYTESWHLPLISFVHDTAHASVHNHDTKSTSKHLPVHTPSIQCDYCADIAFAPPMRCPPKTDACAIELLVDYYFLALPFRAKTFSLSSNLTSIFSCRSKACSCSTKKFSTERPENIHSNPSSTTQAKQFPLTCLQKLTRIRKLSVSSTSKKKSTSIRNGFSQKR